MEITQCPQCGGKVRSESIGWKCESCQGFIDMQGGFHPHQEEPFMPPMTNADKIRAVSDEELAEWLCRALDCGFCKSYLQDMSIYSCCENQVKGIFDWLQSPTEEDT